MSARFTCLACIPDVDVHHHDRTPQQTSGSYHNVGQTRRLRHKLQNPENRREILADEKLKKVFGKDRVSMFEMNKHLSNHLK